MNINFNVPSTVIIGGGARAELTNQVKRLGASRILVITDPFMIERGVVDRIIAPLKESGISVSTFSDVQPDPTDQNVSDGLRQLRQADAQAIVAIGGGSPIDAAKVIGIGARNSEPLSQYAGYHKIPNAGIPIIAIPTTAGTGSEVTKVAVITDTDRNVKMMMLDVHLLPRVALVDYELTLSMPSTLTANVGVDTLIHAIEAFVSRKANLLTDPIALACIRLVAGNLLTAYLEPNNRQAREAMMLASCQGGMAFANSSVCLVHGMSRPLGAVFHLPHGLSNALLLPSVIRFSVRADLKRYAIVSRSMGFASEQEPDESAAQMLVEGVEKLNRDLGIPMLRDCLNMDRSQYDATVERMASDALASGSPQNNPRVPSLKETIELYHAAW